MGEWLGVSGILRGVLSGSLLLFDFFLGVILSASWGEEARSACLVRACCESVEK